MGFGIVLLAVLSAVVIGVVLVTVTSIGQARWQRREGDAHTA